MLSWSALALALLQALPELIALLKSIDERARSAADRQEGYNAAVADTLKGLAAAQASDAASDVEAARDHAAHPDDDSGFDQEFRRD